MGGESDGGGIAFTNRGIICDTTGMSDATIEHLVGMHKEWKADQDIKKAERRERLIGYVMKPIGCINNYFKRE